MATVIGLDIGGTKIAAARVVDGVADNILTTPTPAKEGPEKILDAAAGLASQLGEGPIGVSSAGLVNPFTGTIQFATSQLTDWKGTDVAGGLKARLGAEVSVLNDVQSHALGEFLYGVGRGHDSMLLVAPGTGIGGGAILNGKLLLGAHFAAGHVGHVDSHGAEGIPCTCGLTGHSEAIASGYGIERAYQGLTGTHLTGAEIALSDDPVATDVLTQAGLALGRLIGGLINVFDPGLVVTAGSVMKAGPVWEDAFHRGFDESCMELLKDTPVVKGALDNAALVGAAAWVTERKNYEVQ